jgi:hypothetical protein
MLDMTSGLLEISNAIGIGSSRFLLEKIIKASTIVYVA